MSASETGSTRALAAQVSFGDEMLRVRLSDGREVSVPLEWFPALRDAAPRQRARRQLIGGGVGIHWPDLDEDISVEGLLRTRMSWAPVKESARAVNFFVKNGLVHRYPMPPGCKIHYDGEELHDSPPTGHEKCDLCLSRHE